MAKGTHSCLFFVFLSLLTVCSYGTLVGFSYHAKDNDATPTTVKSTASFLKLNKAFPDEFRVFVEKHKVLNFLKDTSIAFDLLIRETEVEKFLNSQTYAISWMKSNLVELPPHVKINSLVVSYSNVPNDLAKILNVLEVADFVIRSLHLKSSANISVEFPLSSLKASTKTQKRNLHRIFDLIKKVKFSVVIKDSVDGKLSMANQFSQMVVDRASFVSSILPANGVPVFLTISSPVFHCASKELADFVSRVSLTIKNTTKIMSRIAGVYVELPSLKNFVRKEVERKEEPVVHALHRELLSSVHPKTTLHDAINPPLVFPAPPALATPLTTTPGSSAPTIVTIPATNPITVTPTSPSAPVQIPSSTPVPVPPTNPADSPVPVSNPPPTSTTPVPTPVTNPVAPPATTNAPGISGQSWCVAKTGVSQTALQAALDYACGVGGADCSQIQPGASCYNPEGLQSHASYAFNSYYQKHPAPTSCDFGGTAVITNANPSTGSCIYPSSSSATSSAPPTTPNPATPPPITVSPPMSTNPPPTPAPPLPPVLSPPKSTTPPTSIPPPASGISGSGFPPLMWNSSIPTSGGTTGFGLNSPPNISTTDSGSADLQPLIGSIILITSFITGKFVLWM